jgi:DNA polymerase III epsilon subunit-like protein
VTELAYTDTETTGTSVDSDDPIEVAVLRGTLAGGIVAAHRWLARPRRPIAPDAERTHGINNALAARFPPPEQVAPHVNRAVSDGEPIMVGYNLVEFDRPLLWRWLREHGQEPAASPWALDLYPVCNWRLREGAPGVPPGRGLTKLDLGSVCRQLDVDLANAHSAVFDALATLGIHRRFVRDGTLPACVELACAKATQDAAACRAEFARWRWYFYCRDGKTLRVGFGKHAGLPVTRVSRGYWRHLLGLGWEFTEEEERIIQLAAAGDPIPFDPPTEPAAAAA